MQQEFNRLNDADKAEVSALWARLDEESRAIVKRQVMAHRVLQRRADGASPEAALDAVCGAGTYGRLINEIHETVHA